MNCQFKGCTAKATHEILWGPYQDQVTPVCQSHLAEEYCSDVTRYSGCRFLPLGADRTPRFDPHTPPPSQIVPISAPPEGAGCGGCRGCK